MNGNPELYRLLEELQISYQYYEHPPAPTIDEAMKYWKDIEATHCKNLFFRNHKGNKHYLVLIECSKQLGIHALEKMLNQGKLSFASAERMMKHLGVTPGSVTPYGLINNQAHDIHVFLDKNLQQSQYISFHPCINTASIVIKWQDFIKFLNYQGNTYEFIDMYA